MRKISWLGGFLLLVLFSPSPLEAQTLGQIFGGYSYVRTDVPVVSLAGVSFLCVPPSCLVPSGTTSIQTNGWEVAAALRTGPLLRVAADFSGHYSSFGGLKVNTLSYMFGPELASPARVSPFIHAFVGQGRRTEGAFTQTSLATALGGGVDVKAAPFVKIRLFQIDYFRTAFDGQTQRRPRLSAGIVLSF